MNFSLLLVYIKLMITLKKVLFKPLHRNSYINFVCVTYILLISFCYAFSLTETFFSVIKNNLSLSKQVSFDKVPFFIGKRFN